MDISYLLLLQNFREATHNILTPFFWQLSEFAVGVVPIFAAAIFYWVFDKEAGGWLIWNVVLCHWLNGIMKLTACVYRPWIRDARIVPAGNSIHTATGYSFPSGHSMLAGANYGSAAVYCWQRKKTRWLSVVFGAALLLTMFARNYLGVHTPQDVLVGGAVSLCVVFATGRLYRWMQAGDGRRDVRVLWAGLAAAALSLLYITVKSYPMDYVNGILLVNPEDMKPDVYNAIASLAAVAAGWYIEKRFIRFENPANKRRGLLVAILAFIPEVLWLLFFAKFAPGLMGAAAAKTLLQSVPYLYTFTVVPMAMKKFAAPVRA